MIRRIRKAVSILLILGMVLGMFPYGNKVSAAAAVHSLDETKVDAINAVKFVTLGKTTLTSYKWNNGADGKISYADNGNGNMLFQLKTKSRTSGYTYVNPLTLHFDNVMTVAGRSVNATLNVDRLEYYAPYDSSVTPADYKTAIQLTGYTFWANNDGNEGRAGQNLTIRTSFTWADTGEKADIPIYQIVSDMDMDVRTLTGSTDLNEGWKGISGYTGDIYAFTDYSDIYINPAEMKAYANHGRGTGYNLQGDDSLIKGGLIASCSGTEITQMFTDAWAGTSLQFASPLDDRNISAPVKSTEDRLYKNGENITWDISYVLHTWTADIFSPYTELTFTDELPEETEYKKAVLYHDGKDVTSDYGTLSYDKGTRTVTYRMNQETLNNPDFYDGKTLRLQITTAAVNRTDTLLTAVNKGKLSVNGISWTTNEASARIDYDKISLSLQKVWEDVENEDGLRPDSIDVTLKAGGSDQGTYKVTKEDDWKLTVENLPKYSQGKEISYTWKETPVNGYASDINTSGYNTVITNVHSPVYAILTEIDNGVITKAEAGVPRGESRTVTWTPAEGRYIDKVFIDGKETTVSGNSYTFSNVTADHEISVTTLPYLQIKTDIDYGIITDKITDIRAGESRTVSWTPGTGRYVSNIAVDGKEIYSGNKVSGYPVSYEFKDVKENHEITVQTELIPILTIEKSSDKDVYNADENIMYTLTIKQTVEGAKATNVVITDAFDTDGLQMEMETAVCSKDSAKIQRNEKGFTVSLDELSFGETVTVTVKGIVLKEHLSEGEILNTASVKSDQTEEVSAGKEVEINYNIITYVDNGTIDSSMTDVKYGETRTVNYRPDEGCYPENVRIDGKDVDIEQYGSAYTFPDVKDNHLVEVKYLPYLKAVGKIDYGTITDKVTDIKAGESHTISWKPEEGRYVSKVIVNEAVYYEGNAEMDYPTSYEAKQMEEDVEVIVETEPVPVSSEVPEEPDTTVKAEIGEAFSMFVEETTTEAKTDAVKDQTMTEVQYISPKTGGQALRPWLFILLALPAGGIAVVTGIKERKKSENKKASE